jgi:hypothetical protein
MTNNFNKTPHFPYTYGDDIENDGQRLSDFIVNKLSQKETRNYLGAIFLAILTLGSQAAPSNAIPAEYGEAAANVVKDIPQQGVPGANTKAIPSNPVNIQQLQQQAGQKAAQAFGAGGPQIQGVGDQLPQNPNFRPWIPGPPITPQGRAANSAALMISLTVICMNGAWGSPWAAVVCAGGLFRLAESLLGSVMK